MDRKPVHGIHYLFGSPVSAESVIGLIQILLQVLKLIDGDVTTGQICGSHGYDLVMGQTKHQLRLGVVPLGALLDISPDTSTGENGAEYGDH